MKGEPSEVSLLLREWRNGDSKALDALLPIAYEELRRLAHFQLQKERIGHTLESAALVNEAYLRLTGLHAPQWESRTHFFAIAAQLMRQILVDHARRKQAGKRAGIKVPFDEAVSFRREGSRDLLALDSALTELEKIDPRKCKAVELRYFGGLSMEEIARTLEVSEITVRRDLRMAEAWLRQEMTKRVGVA